MPLLRETLLTSGFFYLSDVAEEMEGWQRDWDAAFEVSRSFFDENTDQEKSEIAMVRSRHFRGYSAVGAERTLGRVDLREQIDLG